MVTTKAVPAVAAVYPLGDAIWQDDPASIHRTQNALAACTAFAERIPHNVQAAKCSDIWPIEQVFDGIFHSHFPSICQGPKINNLL